MQKEEISDLIFKLERIKKMGYIDTLKNLGKEATLHNLLELNSNDVIIKCDDINNSKYVTFFNATPVGKDKNQIRRLKEKYGFYDNLDFKNKVFKSTAVSTFTTFIKSNYLLKLFVSYEDKRIYLQIYDKNYVLIEQKTYWPFEMLKSFYEKKAKYLFLVKTWVKEEKNSKYYKYYDFSGYQLKTFEEFLKLVEEGIIRVNFRVNVYNKGYKKNQIKDDGTSFEIQEIDLLKLYDKIY